MRDDELGRLLMDKLVEKAAAGVEVRFLADYIGSHRLPRHFFRPLTEAGGQAAYFFPLKLGLLSPRLNYRNHRKLANRRPDRLYRRVQRRRRIPRPKPAFRLLARHASEGGGLGRAADAGGFLLDWTWPRPTGRLSRGSGISGEKRTGALGMQIVSSGPDQDQEQIKNGFIKMIHEAESFIYIQTPYFIPDDSFLTAIRIASLSGVDVRIMIPARPDHRTVYWATFAHLGDLLQSGVKIVSVRQRISACENDGGGRQNRHGRHGQHRQPQLPPQLRSERVSVRLGNRGTADGPVRGRSQGMRGTDDGHVSGPSDPAQGA